QVLIYLVARPRYRELMARSVETQARSHSYLVELVTGMKTLKAAAAEQRAVERWSNLYVDELNASLERGRLSALVDALMDLVTAGSPLLILTIGANMVLGGSLTLGTMLAVSAMASGLIAPLSALANA